jgi:hypothetical protein
MIQAARLAPVLRPVTSPASSLRRLRSSGPVTCNPAGPATREESRVEAAGIEPAVAVTCVSVHSGTS